MADDYTTEAGIQAYLISALYPLCDKVERLSEGFSGFVFRAHQNDESLPPTVVIKHVEPYAARMQQWKIDQNRMASEWNLQRNICVPQTKTAPGL
jgi:hypothetical protein